MFCISITPFDRQERAAHREARPKNAIYKWGYFR